MVTANNVLKSLPLAMLTAVLSPYGIFVGLGFEARAQEMPLLDQIVADTCDGRPTLPVINFAPTDVAADLAFLGNYFFGHALTEDQAVVDNGRYQFFYDGYSKLWYYPSSGAFEWTRINPPIAFDHEVSADVLLALIRQGHELLVSMRRERQYPGEGLEFLKSSRVVAAAGTLMAESEVPETYVRRVDITFQQKFAGVPAFEGPRASISFCGDMEICRASVSLRTICEVSLVDTADVSEVQRTAKSALSSMDGPYYVDHIDTDRSARVVYGIRSRSHFQAVAVPHIIIPVCKSKGGHRSSDCEVRSEIASPLVSNSLTYANSEHSKTRNPDNSAVTIVERPSICDQSPNLKECAP